MVFLTPPPADRTPKLVLVRWRAWEVQVPDYDAPSWHLMGFLSEESCSKVSSALAEVSAAGDEARSKTGRRYSLATPPGVDAAAARLWGTWVRHHRVVVLREVTSDILAGHQPLPVRRRRQPEATSTQAAMDASLRGDRKW